MIFGHDEIKQGVGSRIRVTAGVTPPPPVLAALLALTREQAVDHVVASHEPSDVGTKWRVLAMFGRALAMVDASSPRPDWTLENSNSANTLAEDDALDARVIRIADIESISVRTTNFEAFGEWTFNGDWRLSLRDGRQIDVRATQRTNTAREACDAFALDLIKAIAKMA